MNDIEFIKKLKGISPEEPKAKEFQLPEELKKEIELLSEEIVHSKMPPPTNKIVNPESVKQILKEEYKEKLEMRNVGKSLSQGLFLIMSEGRKYLNLDDFTRTIDEFEMAFDRLMKMESDAIKDQSVKQLAGISDETIGSIERMAIQKHKEKDLISSERLFFLLTILDPDNFAIWLRLGIVHQENKNYIDALKSYGRALNLNTTNIPNHLFMAECYMEIKDKFNALQECDRLRSLIGSQDIDIKWKECFENLEKAINNM